LSRSTADKEHQGKPTASVRKPYTFTPAGCVICGAPCEATSRMKDPVCSPAHKEKLRRQKAAPPPIPCAICGEPFNAIRGATVCAKPECRNARRRKRAAE
jgi:hypothetical protein